MRARILIGLLLLVTLLGIGRVRMDVDILDLLPDTLPEVQGLKQFLQHFSRDDEILLLVECADPDPLETLHASLAQHLRQYPMPLGQVLSEGPWSIDSTETLGELIAWLLLNATSEEAFAASLDKLRPAHRAATLEDSLDTIGNSMEIDEALSLAYDPYQLVQTLRREQASLLAGNEDFVSDDGSLRLLIVQAPSGATQNYQTTTEWVDRVKQAAQTWQASLPQPQEVQLGFTGEPVFEAEISASMQRDMMLSGSTALLLTALIFGLAYRRLRPLAALTACLTLTFALTLGLAGWMLDSITVMSVGFASILIGLTVDYGVLLYQESLRNPGAKPDECRRRVRPSIAGAAVTTAAAFGALSLSVVPGVSTLGQLVALGIVLGAVVMLLFFPFLQGASLSPAPAPPPPSDKGAGWLGAPATLFLLLLAMSPFWLGFPPLDPSTDALRPRHSGAYDAMDQLEAKLTGNQAATPLAILTLTESTQDQLARWETALEALPGKSTFPRALIRHAAHQEAQINRLQPEHLDGTSLERAALDAGFEPSAMELTRAILEHWRQWKANGLPTAPQGAAAQRLWSRFVNTDATGQARHLMMSYSPLAQEDAQAFWSRVEAQPDSLPVSWPRITEAINDRVPRDLRQVGAGLGLAVIFMLVLTFRRPGAVLLTLAMTGTTLLALCGAMAWLGWPWNFFSIGALLLTFGAGLDYSIHILLDHRRLQGDLRALQAGVLRALRVCALSTVVGFGSIAWASHQGLASLGRACALGLALNALAALVVLPWGLRIQQNRRRL